MYYPSWCTGVMPHWYYPSTRPRHDQSVHRCTIDGGTRTSVHMTLLTVLTGPRWTGGTGPWLQACHGRESGHGGMMTHGQTDDARPD